MMKNSKPYDSKIQYIESDGACYLNLGFNPTNAITMDFRFNRSVFAVTMDCGAETGWSSKIARFISNTSPTPPSNCYWRYANGGVNVTTGYNLIGDIAVTINGRNITVVNETTSDTYTSAATAGTFTTPADFLVFGVGVEGSANSPNANCAGCRLYHFKVTDNGVNFDLIPVRVGQVGYMYDQVSGQLFGNLGTGSFILGNDVA